MRESVERLLVERDVQAVVEGWVRKARKLEEENSRLRREITETAEAVLGARVSASRLRETSFETVAARCFQQARPPVEEEKEVKHAGASNGVSGQAAD